MGQSQYVGRAILLAPILVALVAIASGVSTSATDDRRADPGPVKERREFLIRKINEGQHLSSVEISNLNAILLMDGKNDDGIAVLEKLATDRRYMDQLGDLYLGLSLFYAAKASASKDETEKQRLRDRGEQYLTAGFNSVKEKPMAYYKKAQVEGAMGCFSRAISDLRSASKEAESQKLVFFGEGVYLAKQQFIEMIDQEIARLTALDENCPRR